MAGIIDKMDAVVADLERDHQEFNNNMSEDTARKLKLDAELLAEYLRLYLINLEDEES